MSEEQANYTATYIASRDGCVSDEGLRTLSEDIDAKPLDRQVGGDHYKRLKIQPIEYCLHNNLNVAQSKVVKYITRYPFKNGVEDLQKAKHMIDILIEFEESKL